MAIDGVGVLAMDSGAGGMSDEAGRLVFSRDPSGTFIDGMVFGTSGGGENANLEVLCALPYELVRPHASASVLGPLVGVGNVKRLSLSVKYLDGEISVGRYDRVSGFLVEQARALVGGDAEYQLSAVVCRPGVAERLDLRSEAFAPMLPDDRDPFDEGCMLGESLSYLCGMDPARPGAVYERLGYAKGWLDEGRAYQCISSSRCFVFSHVFFSGLGSCMHFPYFSGCAEVFLPNMRASLTRRRVARRRRGRWCDGLIPFVFLSFSATKRKNARSRCWNVGDGRCNQYSERPRIPYLAGSRSVAAQCIVLE